MTSRDADWSNVPLALLSSIFGKQQHALDNCAAACTCVRWRSAAAESHISYLHLHADRSPYNSSWRSFFNARHHIDRLKLTSDARHHRRSWACQMAKSLEQGLCVDHIPQGCRALFVSEDFLRKGCVISRLVGLQQLTVTWSTGPWKISNRDGLLTYPSFAFPDLAVLPHLTQLELRQGAKYFYAVATFPKPSQPLPVLQRLVLARLRVTGKLLSSCSTALTSLELHGCEVVDFDGVQIDKLRKLDLECSRVRLHRSYITALTQLTFLGLAHSIWQVNGELPPDPFKAFVGWLGLKRMQCNGCNLFDRHTEVHIGSATHLQVSYVRPDVACPRLSVVQSNWKARDELRSISVSISSAACADCLVRLQLLTMAMGAECGASLSGDLSFLLEACPRLQVLLLGRPGCCNTFSHPATLALDSSHGASLQKLQLQNLQFVSLDLIGAPCLSSIRLSGVDRDSALCKLSLPISLQSFAFEGSYLFTEHGRFALSDSSVLTKLDLLPLFPETGYAQYEMPVLPDSLLHVTIKFVGPHWCHSLAGCLSLTHLQACTSLERLTVFAKSSSDERFLEVLVNAARRLHVIEYYEA